MNKFRPHINVDYPPNNRIIFEEWFAGNYKGCNTDRELLPVFFTSYWVNNNYGNDKEARRQLNDYLGTLDKSKKWFSVIQYDDGSMIDWGLFGLDVLEFNMSKTNGVMLPLICMPHPYSFSSGKKYFASFIGSRTHIVRNEIEKMKGFDGYYISFEPHDIRDYCRVLHESMFALCPRGYGLNSFRISEAIQYGAIPVYISDEFIEPFGVDFNDIGIKINADATASDINDILSLIEPMEVVEKQSGLDWVYSLYYTHPGCLSHIINHLEAEYNNRKQDGKIAYAFGAVAKPKD